MKWPRLNLRETVIQHAGWEMFLMRLFLLWPCWLVIERTVVKVQPRPNGLAHWIDFTFLGQPGVQQGMEWLFFVAGALFVAGRWVIPALGLIVAMLVAKGTLVNSQGAINHALQLLTLVMLGQWIVYCFRAKMGWSKSQTHLQAVHWAKVIMAASYVSAAICKLFASSEFWIARAPYMALQVVKSNMQAYYNDLVTTGTPLANAFPYWVVENPNLARVFFTGGLLLELFAFLALVNRWWALFIGVSMLLLHWSVQLLMSLEFKHHVYLLLIFYVNAPWLLYAGGKWLAGRFGRPVGEK